MSKESRHLVKILRHCLVKLGLVTDSEGYVALLDIKKSVISLSKITEEQVLEMVRVDNKGRLGTKIVNNKLYIRANQGHSTASGSLINDGDSLTRILEPIDGVFHATYKNLFIAISKTGLNRMGRKHIHIAKSLTAKSGKRRKCDLLVYVDMKACIDDGILFYESDNGVILTEGKDGVLDPKYLKYVYL
jgi:2'-phosphotransferase